MVSDQPNTRSPITLLIFAVIVLVVTIGIVMLYLSARQNSLAKTQPYVVELQVNMDSAGELNEPMQIMAQYDYGYGFNRGHEQSLVLEPSNSTQALSFTVSAWKQLHSLRFISSSQKPINISGVSISKNLLIHQFDSIGSVSINQELLIEHVHTSVLGAYK